ncbi:MAG: fused MFS/spermidine synthase [Alphaproteobacteria bacterium]|nr:fused MFS/spermidine synthase [Alphaproteobacteria bacterium]
MPRGHSAPTAADPDSLKQARPFLWLIYLNAFVTGTIIMSFEMLGSRYLNPYFGSGIYTWAALIATVLIALMVGYFIGGWLVDRRPSHKVLALLIVASSAYLGFVPLAADPILAAIFDNIESVRTGSLAAALALLFVPLTLLGVYSPFAIRLTLRDTARSGSVAGRIYGVSTFGSVFGTLITTFTLIPALGSRSITYLLAGLTLASGLSFLIAVPAIAARRGLVLACAVAAGLSLLPGQVLAAAPDVFARYDVGSAPRIKVEQIETEYNNIFVTRQGDFVTMSFRVRRRDETESVINLRDPGALPLPYTRAMTLAVAYVDELDTMLMIGLGGGTTSRYLKRHLPNLDVTIAELDPGVIAMARKHFKLKEGPGYRIVPRDGRVLLTRNRKARYDIIMVDAFRGGYVPFHLLTREFYQILKQRLAPGGVAVFNIHGGTKLFDSTIATLKSVFGNVETVPAAGSVIAVVRLGAPLSLAEAKIRAAARQRMYNFRYDLTEIFNKRTVFEIDPKARILTDDFAPVNLYDSIKRSNKKHK